jgi:hypothetical protein
MNKMNADEEDNCSKFYHLGYLIHHEWIHFHLHLCQSC